MVDRINYSLRNEECLDELAEILCVAIEYRIFPTEIYILCENEEGKFYAIEYKKDERSESEAFRNFSFEPNAYVIVIGFIRNLYGEVWINALQVKNIRYLSQILMFKSKVLWAHTRNQKIKVLYNSFKEKKVLYEEQKQRDGSICQLKDISTPDTESLSSIQNYILSLVFSKAPETTLPAKRMYSEDQVLRGIDELFNRK